MTPGKMAMIEASRSPAEEILDHLRETLDGDLVTKPILENKVRAAARVLSHSRIENDPGSITRKLWRDLGSLRSGDRHGSRYTIDTTQMEVRAVREKPYWKGVDEARDSDKIVDEVKKSSAAVRVMR